jgi:hypothetical protein
VLQLLGVGLLQLLLMLGKLLKLLGVLLLLLVVVVVLLELLLLLLLVLKLKLLGVLLQLLLVVVVLLLPLELLLQQLRCYTRLNVRYGMDAAMAPTAPAAPTCDTPGPLLAAGFAAMTPATSAQLFATRAATPPGRNAP